MNKKLIILIAIAVLLIGGVFAVKYGNFGTNAIWNLSNGGQWLLPLIAVAAIIDSVNPCAFSILLLTIAFLFSMGKERSHILKTGAVYVAGIYIMYFLIGVSILKAIQLFNIPHFFTRFFAIVMIALGLVEIVKEFFPKLLHPCRWRGR